MLEREGDNGYSSNIATYYTTTEEVTELAPVSILTRRTLAEIAEDEGGDIEKASTGDPKNIPKRTGVKRRKKGAKAKVWHSKAH